MIHATMQIGIKISALSDVFKTMGKKNLQPRILCAARVSFIFEEEIEFNEYTKLKEFSTSKQK